MIATPVAEKRKEISLKVLDPDPSHVGRNIITLDQETKTALEVTSGDIIEIEGTKKTAAVIWPARAEDEGKQIIRMDNLIRHNAGVGLGEKVAVRKADPKEAKKVVLAPTQEVRIIASGYDRILKKNFIGRPLTRGDNVWISVFGSGFVYTVVETNPRGIVKVNDSTQFVLKEQPVKEALEGVPKVAYEDIGGLEDQVQKVREMIELPMRHPELFRRLGIQPPKGVLLHGPPGCGKTLLAKAVANETNAHFISVAAPALMCVGAETRILTNPAGEKTAGELFEEGAKNGNLINDGALKIVELEEPIKVFGVNKDLKVKKGEITHITKLKAKTIRICTNLGEEVVVSSNQPFAVLDAFGNIAWKTAGELKQGDLVAAARMLPESVPESFDVFKLCGANLQVNTPNRIKNFTEAVLAGDMIQLPDSRNNTKNRAFVKIPTKPSEELMHLLGLMYSEGYLSKDGVVFTNYDAVLLGQFSELCKSVFGIPAIKKKTRAICYSTTARLFLEKVLGFPVGKKGDYSLPEWYFKISKEQAARFLQGFWEGDGTVGKGIGDYPTIRFYAKGKKILADLSVLSKKLGWVCRLAPWKTPYGLMNALVLAGNRSRELFAQQIVSRAAKFERITKWYAKRIKKGDDLCFPDISPLLKKIKNEKGLVYGKTLPEAPTERYISGRDPLTHRKLEEINELFGKPALLDRLAKADLSWSRITSIESEGEKELFDFTVEPFNNFLAGHSLLVLHNSKFVGEAEERIRQVFKEAEENAPSIIFFDEIDAIAPKRDEVIGEVERRVVAQLLASMDGMEARGNVIVIAATNRVNSIDEALRRPGRFDREIEFPVPDKSGRKEVLQIHSRGMPLAKDVDLDYYAGIAHGFVGADLAALAKEAAMKALRRYLPKMNLEDETIPPEVLEDLEVNRNDFNEALKDVQPSALREVTIEVPNVKWVDVGALESAKQELKQAVEWPLKYPEAFKNLGIRPPRGVLLYGPPGCGKTLLAKAVATESEANFISVKGPELISMWVGESLPFDEELLVFDGKKIFREKIGKIVEEKQNLQVVTFDNDGKVFFSGITDFIKHPLNGKMLEITTKTGRKIRVTDKHSLFSLVENEIEPVVPSQLVEGKSVVAIPAKIPNVSFGKNHLNLLELFGHRRDFFIKSQQTKELIKKTGYKKASEITGLEVKYLYDIAWKELSLSTKNFSLLLESAEEKALLENAKIFRKGARNALPAILPLNEELFELIGLWVAEGDINNGVPRISILDEEIMRETKGILGRLCLNYSVFEGRGIVINSTTLTSVFGELGLETGSFNKKIPNNLLVAPNNIVHAFLRGYFSGDGTIRDNGHSSMIEATTVSEQLANDLLYLLLKLSIVANHATKKEWTGSISHRIQIFGAENFKRFSLAGFIDKKRNSMIQEYLNKVGWKRSNVIPVNPKIESVLAEAFVSYPQNQAVGKQKIRQALLLVDAQKERFPDLWKIVEADIFWDTVKKIEEIDYDGFVFDISVEPCQNFVAGFGGLFAHNSERGIRKVFKKARQVSPVIVFFDEIDSIASHRGSSTDSGASERVVNQLLTELDGIEASKDVVFIAATNRPDLIDPGLLRPGRIDKMIKINAPDENARLAIFKVHVKKVPLAKDVSVEELAKKTDGFSGADIEGLIREAALIALSNSNMKAKIVEKKHFDAALQKMLPSITKETEEAYDEFRTKVGTFKPSYIE